MQLSKRTQYGIRAMICLADAYERGFLQTKELSSREQLPTKFLESILAALTRGKFLTSKIGVTGGYRLARAPGGTGARISSYRRTSLARSVAASSIIREGFSTARIVLARTSVSRPRFRGSCSRSSRSGAYQPVHSPTRLPVTFPFIDMVPMSEFFIVEAMSKE